MSDPIPVTQVEREARAATLLLNAFGRMLLPSDTLRQMADAYEASVGKPSPHAAYDRDHAINDEASLHAAKLLRSAADRLHSNDD